jgi:hypothetical protein
MTSREPRAANKEAWDFTGQGTILLVEDGERLRSLIAPPSKALASSCWPTLGRTGQRLTIA